MAKRTRFAEYKDRYPNFQFELSEEGILLMQCHTNGGSLVLGLEGARRDVGRVRRRRRRSRDQSPDPHRYRRELQRQLGSASGVTKPLYVAMDDEKASPSSTRKPGTAACSSRTCSPSGWPMISAVNGPCNIHSEVPLLGDIVLASEDAYFQDLAHFPRGMVPGDGQHVIWPLLVGRNRARYLLLTGKKLSAQEALEWGAVKEVLPKHRLLERAWELARELAKRPPLTLRYTRMLFTQDLKRAFLDELGHGLARETYAQRQFFPISKGEWRRSIAPGTRSPGRTRTRSPDRASG